MDFSISFQLKLLVLLFTDKDFFLQTKKHLKPEYFNSIFFQWLLQLLNKYFEEYKDLPTVAVVEQEFQTADLQLLLEEEKYVVEFLDLFIKGTFAESAYIKSTFDKFIKSRIIAEVLRDKGDEAIKAGDISVLSSVLREKSTELDFKSPKEGLTFDLNNLVEIYENRKGINSGIKLIDNVIGGLMKKELSLLLGDANVGKSLLATYIGGHVVKEMHHVLHVTLEMSKARTLIRYYTNLSEPEDQITYGKIHNFQPEDQVLDYVKKLRERYEGFLVVEEFPTGKCSIEDLYRLLDKHPRTELLIVDYLDLMKPTVHREHVRFELTELCVNLRGLAAERNIHVNSPTQANKLAAGRRIVGKEFSAEDYGKMRVADWVVGLGQNSTDLNKHELVLNIARSRNSEKNKAERYFMNFQTMSFRCLGEEILGGHG